MNKVGYFKVVKEKGSTLVRLKCIDEFSTSRIYHTELRSVAEFVRFHLCDDELAKEHVWVLIYDVKMKLLGIVCVAQGSTMYSNISNADILQAVLLFNAVSFVVVHNHPSGDCTPSVSDQEMTTKLLKAADVIGLTFADHIIMGDKAAWSLKSNHKMYFTLKGDQDEK